MQYVIGWQFHVWAYRSLRRGSANMYVLISLGTNAAYIYSLFSIIFARVRVLSSVFPLSMQHEEVVCRVRAVPPQKKTCGCGATSTRDTASSAVHSLYGWRTWEAFVPESGRRLMVKHIYRPVTDSSVPLNYLCNVFESTLQSCRADRIRTQTGRGYGTAWCL